MIKNGTIRHSSTIDFMADPFSRLFGGADRKEGFYVYFTGWKGPFKSKEDAADAYREWACEARYS